MNMINDILIYGRDLAQHDQRLVQVIRCLELAGVKLSNQKCAFRVTSVKFLGVIVDGKVIVNGKGISPDPRQASHHSETTSTDRRI